MRKRFIHILLILLFCNLKLFAQEIGIHYTYKESLDTLFPNFNGGGITYMHKLNKNSIDFSFEYFHSNEIILKKLYNSAMKLREISHWNAYTFGFEYEYPLIRINSFYFFLNPTINIHFITSKPFFLNRTSKKEMRFGLNNSLIYKGLFNEDLSLELSVRWIGLLYYQENMCIIPSIGILYNINKLP